MGDSDLFPSNLSVLIVDDHDPMRKSLRRVIDAMGFSEVYECSGGHEAKKTLEKKSVDFIISDLFMRQGSGFELLEYIRNRPMGSDLPFLVVTGEASKEEIVKVAHLGAEDYLLKPFQTTDLEKKITRVLTNHFSPPPLIQAQRHAEKKYLDGHFPEAVDAFQAALSLDPHSPRTLHGLGRSLFRMGRPDSAIQTLEKSIATHGSYHKNYAALADIHLARNQIDQAIAAMKKELEIHSKQSARQTQLGLLLLKQGAHEEAIDHFRVALQNDPRLIKALMGMGQAFAALKNIDKALYYYKRVRRHHPQATTALEAAVRVAVAAKEPRKAEMFLKDEKRAHPENFDSTVILGLFYLRFDRDDDAYQLAQSMLEKDPLQPQALKILSMVHLKRQDLQSALQCLESLAKVAPSAESLLQLGEIYLKQQKIPDAIKTLTKALGLSPNSSHILYALAEAHFNSQQWLKALILYQKSQVQGFPTEKTQKARIICLSHVKKRRQHPKKASA